MVSIIIVHYHVKKELFAALRSIIVSKTHTKYEIVVVDNDEKKTIHADLKKQFPKVRYVANENKGFGQGNNVGANYAKGEYLFFLNPDTTIYPQCIDTLERYLEKYNEVGIVAPLLYDNNEKIVRLQGARELTPLRAVFSFSFINRLFPKNPIAKNYWYLDEWDKKIIKEVDSIPGTAFMIRQQLYKKLQGFDEHFFLYFEENDLCKRARDLGWKIIILPKAKVFHALGRSTKQLNKDVGKIFRASRYYYLKKHFGWLLSIVSEAILRVSKYSLLLSFVVIFGAFLRIFVINRTMVFIGDQGWFYLSARDMILKGELPLVGIVSSHPWLHQGAFWTYLLAPVLWLAHFDPVSGAYLSVLIGLLAIGGMYALGSMMFSKRVGLLAAVLLASSPLVVFLDRMPYHTAPIPLLVIFALYCFSKWIQGKLSFFPPFLMALAALYNFELATFLFSIVVLSVWVYGFLRKEPWARRIFDKKILFLAVLGWLTVMLPMLVYDTGHRFGQTVTFFAWVCYKLLTSVGYPQRNPTTPVSFGDMVHFMTGSYQQAIFAYNAWVTIVLVTTSTVFLFVLMINQVKKRSYVLLGVVNLLLLIGLFITKTPSGAYLPMVFPGMILQLAVLFNGVIGSKKQILHILGIVGVICIVGSNSFYLLQKLSSDTSFAKRLAAANSIVQAAGGKEYNLKGQGSASQFESFTMNYEYLTWWLGNGPSKTKQPVEFIISEDQNGLNIVKKQN